MEPANPRPAFVATLETIATDPECFAKRYEDLPEKIGRYSPGRICVAIALSILTFLSYQRQVRPIIVTSLFLATAAAAALAAKKIAVENPEYSAQKKEINDRINYCIYKLNALFKEKTTYVTTQVDNISYASLEECTNTVKIAVTRYDIMHNKIIKQGIYNSVKKSAEKIIQLKPADFGDKNPHTEILTNLQSTCNKFLYGEKDPSWDGPFEYVKYHYQDGKGHVLP